MERPPKLRAAGAVYSGALWLFIVFLVLTQFLGRLWDSMTWMDYARFGWDPLVGSYPIPGSNDEPYSDRSFMCVIQGQTYMPMTVDEALAIETTQAVDTTGTAINGYRVVKRATPTTLVSEVLDEYAVTCSALAAMVDQIFSTCARLNYSVSRDNLRLIDNLSSSTMYQIQYSLPVVVMPYWYKCILARLAIPGNDDSACMFHLDRAVVSSSANRTAREAKTIEYLQRLGGQWKNGWYEDCKDA